MNYENISESIQNNKIIKTESKKWIICLIHFLIYSTIVIILITNYVLTKDNFKDNKVINMKPQQICNIYIKEHNECLNKYRTESEPTKIINDCVGANLQLQTCYDQVQNLNRKCFVYLSEFDKCINDNLTTTKSIEVLREKCKSIIKNINICTSEYMLFDPFILLDENIILNLDES